MQRNDFSSKTFLWGFQQYFAQYPCFIALLYFPFQPNATHLWFKPEERENANISFSNSFSELNVCDSGISKFNQVLPQAILLLWNISTKLRTHTDGTKLKLLIWATCMDFDLYPLFGLYGFLVHLDAFLVCTCFDPLNHFWNVLTSKVILREICPPLVSPNPQAIFSAFVTVLFLWNIIGNDIVSFVSHDETT